METPDDGALGESAPSDPSPGTEGVCLADYIERQFTEMAESGRPTIADILRRIEERGRPTGVPGDKIVAAVRECREEFDDWVDEIRIRDRGSVTVEDVVADIRGHEDKP